ncbi:alpha/beta hydrolase [Limnobacter humi]|uniref:Alpha/beta hydrolase n=1 Tax=Limnobacter humi TaxID=1778671 RepID=A0ABT1WKS1_9BURK|nr:alpha/beta hydrolase [Limnobacter humi]MCQ8897264.1 alpha/beta hydrolase [Limnobacter humi]
MKKYTDKALHNLPGRPHATLGLWLGRLALGVAMVTGVAACSLKQPEGEIQGLAGLAIAAERAWCGLERREVDIDGFKVPYLTGGRGEPLVLIHGFGGSKDNFNRFAKELKNHFTVYAIDVPGFGGSTRVPDADYRINTQADRVHAILQKIGLNKVHIGGNSMGGWISGAYAARYPDAVRSILFLAPAGLQASRKSEVLKTYDTTGKIVLTAGNRAEFDNIVDTVMYKRPAFAPGFVVNAMAERAIRDQALNQRIYKDFKALPSDLASTLKASSYKGPAMIVWGQNDRVLHVDGAAELAEGLPQAKVILMDQTGHVPMMEKPNEVAAAYLAWEAGLK